MVFITDFVTFWFMKPADLYCIKSCQLCHRYIDSSVSYTYGYVLSKHASLIIDDNAPFQCCPLLASRAYQKHLATEHDSHNLDACFMKKDIIGNITLVTSFPRLSAPNNLTFQGSAPSLCSENKMSHHCRWVSRVPVRNIQLQPSLVSCNQKQEAKVQKIE